MKTNMARLGLAGGTLAALLALGGCGDRGVENTEMPVVPQANVEINRQGTEGAKDPRAAAGVDNQGAVRLGTGDTSIMDPDVLVAEQVKAALAANPDFGAVRVEVHADDGDVTLRGNAPDVAARERATEIAKAVRNVRSVDNQLTVS